jgi:hypothetical protein
MPPWELEPSISPEDLRLAGDDPALARVVIRVELAYLLTALLMIGASAWAQTTGTILGTVTDPSGQGIAGAKVTVINEGTREERFGSTGATGTFVVVSLPPGRYTVQVENPGFQKFEQKENVLTATERLSLGNIKLVIGPVWRVRRC